MALNKDKDVKLFYSIKEVAGMIGVNESTLRYWEQVYPQIRPRVNERRVRQYTKKDIDEIRLVYNMVKVRGFRSSAAKKMINTNRSGADRSAYVMETLIATRDQLQELKKQLDTLT